MKYLKSFENLTNIDDHKEIDPEIFLDYFHDIKDEYNLIELSKDIFKNGSFSVNNDNFKRNGYFYSYREPYDKNSKYYNDREGNFMLTIITESTIKRNSAGFYSHYTNDEQTFNLLDMDYPNLRNDIKIYEDNIKKYHKLNKQVCTSTVRSSTRPGSDISLIETVITFYIYTDETDNARTLKMLKSMKWDDNMKSKFKEIGYNLDEKIKVNNISQEDVINCIKRGGYIYATIIKELPKNDPKRPLKPLSIDNDGLITIDYDGKEYEIDIRNVETIDIPDGIKESLSIDSIDWNQNYTNLFKIVNDEVYRTLEKINCSSISLSFIEINFQPSKITKNYQKDLPLLNKGKCEEILINLEESEKLWDHLFFIYQDIESSIEISLVCHKPFGIWPEEEEGDIIEEIDDAIFFINFKYDTRNNNPNELLQLLSEIKDGLNYLKIDFKNTIITMNSYRSKMASYCIKFYVPRDANY